MSRPVRSDSDSPIWADRVADVEIRFLGRDPSHSSREAIARREAGPEIQLAWAHQIHSNRVLAATAGECGEGDALVTERANLALCVVTADCVPVLLADERRIAAVHAGWRGLVSGVLEQAVRQFEEPRNVTAWIGPAIGACCYEVGEEVASRIATSASSAVISTDDSNRPHADLRATAADQLGAHGIRELRHVALCTRCEDHMLWSYRREGPGGGHNLALIWRRP